MKPVKQAKKYAKTLINATGIDGAPAALNELLLVEDLMMKSAEFRSLLENPVFTNEEKEKAFKSVAAKLNLSDSVVKFMLHLTEVGAAVVLAQIIKHATEIYLEKKRRARAVVMTPVEIAGDHEERIKASLKRLTERDVDLEYVIDPSLLGGVLIKVGSTMYDSSIKGQLRLLKDELIKG